MPRDGKKPYSRACFDCAEDLCDPYETDSRDGALADAGVPRSRSRAVRLVDELGHEAPHRTAAQPAAQPAAEEASAGGLSRTEKRTSVVRASRADADYAVLSVKPAGEGDTVAVVLTRPSETDGARERVRLYLLVEQYADLRPREGRVAAEEAEELLGAGRLCAAVKRGMRLLEYGDQSARRLSYKLTARGIDRETAEAAAAYLVKKGYIHENDTARLRAEQDVRKLWGPRRIREDLRANGFTPDAVAEAMEALADTDFESNCVTVMRKKYRVCPTDRVARQKMVAALMRLGYDADVIRAACLRIEREG